MEVATPSVATVSAPSSDTRPPLTPDVDQLRADINRLEKLVNTLMTRSRPRTLPQRCSHRSPTPPSNVHAETLCWYTRNTVAEHSAVAHHVHGRQTSRPATDGGKCHRPLSTLSPLLRTGRLNRLPILGRYGRRSECCTPFSSRAFSPTGEFQPNCS